LISSAQAYRRERPTWFVSVRIVSPPGKAGVTSFPSLGVGTALDRFTRNLLLRNSLRLMRAPAAAAGLGHLQRFLETGFETFRAMRGAQEFLGAIAERERALAAHFDGGGAVQTPQSM
jgi:hypothetical protein